MNKTVLFLLLALSSTSAFTQWGGSGGFGNYGGYGGYSQGRWSGGYTGGWGNSADLTGGFDSTGTTASVANGGAYSCPYAIDNANRAFDQLVEDVRGQVNEWIVYSDLDAVDEVSYYLAKSCDVKKLDVVSEGSQACKGLGGLLKAIVQQAETSAFRGGYQEGAKLSEQALGLGKGVEKDCKVRVVKKQQVQQQKQQNQQGNQKQQKEQIKQKGQEEKTGQSQQKHQVGQKQGSLAKSLDRKFAKISPHDSSKYGQYGNEVGGQLTNKHAGKYTGQSGNNYGKNYIDQGKSMTRLAGNGQGKKYGEDQAALAHKLNKEYTAKYAKDKDNKNEQWKKYQEKYQHNDEEENNFENEEETSFNLDTLFMDLTWM